MAYAEQGVRFVPMFGRHHMVDGKHRFYGVNIEAAGGGAGPYFS